MEKLLKFYPDRRILIFVFILLPFSVLGQYYNCNVLSGDAACFKACELYTAGLEARQGREESQHFFEKAIKQCPSFAPAYMEKAVPYLKRGDLSTWKVLIDKAVKLDPEMYLGYRGWCRFQFARDYEGAISDINSLQELLPGQDIGYCQTGDYHLLITKALCYRGLRKYKKAESEFKGFFNSKSYSIGNYDYLHLGAMYVELDRSQDALNALQRQIQINPDLAENYYYLALAYMKLEKEKEAKAALDEAKRLHLEGYIIMDTYTRPMDKVTKKNIEKAYMQLGIHP